MVILADLVEPAHTALVTIEVQDNVVGDRSVVPALADAAAPILPRIGSLVAAGRAAGVTVVHCTADARPDGRGGNRNARLFMGKRPSVGTAGPGGPAVPSRVHAAVGASDDDIVLGRLHGLSPMTSTSLDPVLRNLGVTTIVAVGVSVNVAVLGFAFEAVNHGYQLVVPRDAVAGVDDAYVDALFAGTLSLLASVTTAQALLDTWNEATDPTGRSA